MLNLITQIEVFYISILNLQFFLFKKKRVVKMTKYFILIKIIRIIYDRKKFWFDNSNYRPWAINDVHKYLEVETIEIIICALFENKTIVKSSNFSKRTSKSYSSNGNQ